MAAQLSPGQHFKFRQVQIINNEPLGIGSYGAVYRANCDKLPCAAKFLHPILFHNKDPGSQCIRERFEQEIHLFSGIRHPHIVQYLGTWTDTNSGLPVLLMELMDESLTHLLERSQQPLPFHQEVNICHDTALALAYLHSNGIIHRDLSSNNVLIAGSKTKVTDFGMSKVLGTGTGMTPFTHCPGTAAYMPPEGMRNPPVYSTKLDCFSFGVLGIQIMTRKFPDPGPKDRAVEDTRSPTGIVTVPILDSERRRSHIDLIAPSHLLLPLALHCLSYRDRDRPSAQELCDQLETLKTGPQYRHSQTQEQDQVAAQVRQPGKLLQHQLRDKDVGIAAGHEKKQVLKDLPDEKTQPQQEMQQVIQKKDRTMKRRERQSRELNQQLRAHKAVVADLQQVLLQREKVPEQSPKDTRAITRERTLETMPQQLYRIRIASATPQLSVDAIQLKWKAGPKAPTAMARGSSAVSDIRSSRWKSKSLMSLFRPSRPRLPVQSTHKLQISDCNQSHMKDLIQVSHCSPTTL